MPRAPKSLPPTAVILLLWMAGLGAAAQFAKIGVPFQHIRALFPAAGAELGLLLSLISFIGIVFGMFAGMIAARLGFRRLLLSALLLGAAMSFWQATLPAFWPMLLSRLIEGISHLIIVVTAPTLIAQTSPARHRNAAMTLWSTFFGVAFAITAWAGLPLVESRGLPALFIAHGLFMLATAALLLPALGRETPPARTAAGISPAAILRQHVRVYTSPHISAPAIGWLFYTITFVSLITILPELVREDARAFVSGTMPLASIAVSLICVTALLRFVPAVNIVVLGFALSGLTISLLWSGIGPPLICIALFAMLGLVQGASFAAVPQLNHDAETQALANGAMAQMGNLGNTIGTPILLAILSGFGLTGMILTVITLYTTGTAAHIWLRHLRAMSAF